MSEEWERGGWGEEVEEKEKVKVKKAMKKKQH